MKQLYIIRHGKSDWKQGVVDFERPLNARGKRDAPIIGKHLLENYDIPTFVLSSTANRAISTARLLLSAMHYDLSKIQETEKLYHPTVRDTLDEIAKVSNDQEVLYLFGHNPGFSELASYLSGEIIELKTCCVAVLELQVNGWDEMSQDTCILKSYISPKQI